MKIGIDAKRAFKNTSGLGNYSRDFISSLINQNKTLDVQLFTTEKTSNLFIPPSNIKIHIPKIGLLKYFWRQIGINKIAKKEEINIFHGLSNEIPIGLNKNIKSIVTIHDVIFKKYPYLYNPFDRFIYTKKTKHACEKSNKIITVSNQTKEDLVTYFKVNPEKISVIYQTCHDSFKKKQKNPDILKKYNLPNDFLLSVGTIEKRKNLKIVLESIKNNPEINLVCIGKKTRYYKKLENYISEKKIKNKILFPTIKKMNDLSDIYKEAKCLVYPSIYEGFGIPIIEALYSKIPAVIFNKKVFREAGGPYSHYFNDKNELKEILKKIWIKQKKIDNRITLSRKYVEKFSSKNQINQTFKIYKNLFNS